MQKVDLNILGRNISIGVKDGDETHLKNLAEFINEKAFKKEGSNFDTIAIMTLLAIAEDSYKTYTNIGKQQDIINQQKELYIQHLKMIENLQKEKEKTAQYLTIIMSRLKTANSLLESKNS